MRAVPSRQSLTHPPPTPGPLLPPTFPSSATEEGRRDTGRPRGGAGARPHRPLPQGRCPGARGGSRASARRAPNPGPAPPRRRPVPGPQPISLGHNTELRQPGPLPQPPLASLPSPAEQVPAERPRGPGGARGSTAAGREAAARPEGRPRRAQAGRAARQPVSREERAPRPAAQPHAAQPRPVLPAAGEGRAVRSR